MLLGRLIGIRGVRGRRVDPDGGGQLLGGWRFALEAPGLASKAALGPVAGRDDGRCAAGVDIGRGEEGDPRVAVFVVVPGEEDLAMATGVLDSAAAVLKSGRYFRVWKCDSLKGLSSLVSGRLCGRRPI